jgi:hypothetical protein
MFKLTVAVLAVALVGSASAEEWRLDAGSPRAFKQSLEAAKDELSPESIQMLGGALKYIWNEGTKAAEAQQRKYTDEDYFRQLDGLSFEEVVHFTDATYEAALKYNSASDDVLVFEAFAKPRSSGAPNQPYRHPDNTIPPRWSPDRYQPHGWTDLTGPGGKQ